MSNRNFEKAPAVQLKDPKNSQLTTISINSETRRGAVGKSTSIKMCSPVVLQGRVLLVVQQED